MCKNNTVVFSNFKERSVVIYSKTNKQTEGWFVNKTKQKLSQLKPKSKILFKGTSLNMSTLGGSISKETIVLKKPTTAFFL